MTTTTGQRRHAAEPSAPGFPSGRTDPNAGTTPAVPTYDFEDAIAPSWALGAETPMLDLDNAPSDALASTAPHSEPLPGNPGRGRNNWASIPTFHKPMLPIAVMEPESSRWTLADAMSLVGVILVACGTVGALVSIARGAETAAWACGLVGLLGCAVCARFVDVRAKG